LNPCSAKSRKDASTIRWRVSPVRGSAGLELAGGLWAGLAAAGMADPLWLGMDGRL
jgi:hypothetical protein